MLVNVHIVLMNDHADNFFFGSGLARSAGMEKWMCAKFVCRFLCGRLTYNWLKNRVKSSKSLPAAWTEHVEVVYKPPRQKLEAFEEMQKAKEDLNIQMEK